MTGLSTNRNDPCLYEVDPMTGQNRCYLVLPDGERQELVLPVRRSYRHLRCGGVTSMGEALSETYAANPKFYGGTYCVECGTHYPVGAYGEFVWTHCHLNDPKGDGTLVGTVNMRPEDALGRSSMVDETGWREQTGGTRKARQRG